MPNEPDWLSAAQLTELNEAIVGETGEPFVMRDAPMLESAAVRPINRWHYGEIDVVRLAAELLLGIARNHPFAQGNKRTAFVAADTFLYLNGYDLRLPDTAAVADLIVEVIAGETDEAVLIDFIDVHTGPRR